VGDDSTGTGVNLGETFKFKGGNNITTAVIGDELTISVSKNLDVNELSSSDSTAIQINDGVNISGILTVNRIQTTGLYINDNNISSTRSNDNIVLLASGSSRIYVDGKFEVTDTAYLNNVTATGTATLPVIKTNSISSDDSTAVQVADGLNVSGTLTVANAVINRIVTDDSSDININGAPVNFAAGGEVLYKETSTLNDLADVTIEAAQLDQFLRYNGSQWVNGSGAAVSAGVGVSFYLTDPTITATGANNNNEIITMQSAVGSASEQTVSKTISNTTDVLASFVSTALNRTVIDGGNWSFINHAYVDSAVGTTSISNAIYKVLPFATGTVTVTGTGTSRTATASAGTPFASANIDAYSNNTVLMLNFNGSNASTIFTDSVIDGTPKTVTASGDAKLSTAEKKFGTASLALDGTGDYVSVASSSDFGFGTGDFTIEGWFYKTTATTQYLFDTRTTLTENSVTVQSQGNGTLRLFVNGAFVLTSSNAHTNNAWNHLAISRASGVTRFFINGVVSTNTYTDTTNYGSTKPLVIGALYNGSTAFAGYIDDFRVTKGAALYTGTFTAPTAELTASSNTVASYLQTPQGLYQITARSSDTVITIDTPSGYSNESAVAGTVWKRLFRTAESPVINSLVAANYNITSTQSSYAISTVTRLGMIVFGTTTDNITLTYVYDGQENASLVVSPLATLHNDLSGLQGGTANQFYHLTSTEYTGTGTGNFVRASAPTITNPSVTGTLNVNTINSTDSTAIQITDGVNISGTLNAKTLVTTNISSEDSTAIQVTGGINVTGSVRLGGLQYPVINGELGQVLSSSGTGTVEWATLTGGGGSNVAADSVTFTGFGSNNIVISDPNISVDLAGVVQYGAVDDSQAIGTSPGTFDSWSSNNYDSAFYIAATLNNTAVEYGTASISVVTNGSDSFISSGGVVSTGNTGQLTYSAGFASPNVTVYGTGTTANNTASYLRINLGDDTATSATVSPAMAVVNNIAVSATTVTNNTSVGDSVGITTVAKIADQFTGTSVDSTVAYDSAFYFAVSRNEINNQTGVAQVSLVQDGTNVYVSTGGVVLSGTEDPQVTYSASLVDLDGDSTYETVRLLATGPSALNSVKYHRINLGSGTVESAAGTAQSLLAAEEYNNTVVNTNVQVGEMENIGTNEKPVDVFLTSALKSAFYFAVTRDENSGEVGTAEISLVHDGSDAFVSSGNVCQSGATNNQVTFGGNIDTGKVRLTATGTSNLNSTTYYRMGLGTSTTAASSGNVATLVSTGLGSTTTILDSWSKTSYRAARYYISATSANGEVQNIEVRLFHNGTTSYINTFNSIYSGNNPLVTLTTTISGDNVRLLASCNFNTTVRSYRIRLSDSESGSTSTYTGLVGSTSISSTTGETFDTFSGSAYTGVHYTVAVSNSTLNTAAVYDVFVVHDGVDAYVMTNYASSDDTSHLNFTATYAAGTITVKAATYNGTSYTLNAYRNHLLRDNGGYRTLDSWSKSTYRSAKYYISISGTDIGEKQNIEVLVTHDGTTPYIVTYNTLYTGASALMDIDAIIESSTFKLIAKNPREKNFTARMYRVLLEDSPTNSTTTYNKRIAPTSVGSSAQSIDTFTSATITGAHYIVTAYNSAEGTASVSEVSVVTNADDAYVSSIFVSSKNTEQLTFTADYNAGTDTVTLYAASTSGSSTTVSAYRTNLLRDANAGLNTIDSWSKTSYRGAKYYISAKDTDTGEVSNVEAIVVHDNSVAYVMPFNQNNTDAGDVPLITLAADINSGNVRLQANAPTSVNYDVRMYRVRLQDSEVENLGTYTKLLDTVTVTSEATTIDEFSSVSNDDSSAAYVGCYYFVTAYNSTEGTASAYDVYVASEGVTASVASSFVSSKSGPMLTFDTEHTNGTVTLSATSNSGGNTTVNIYRHQLPKPTATEAFKVLDSWNKTIYRGAKYFITTSATNLGEYNAQEVAVVHNGSDAYNTVYNLITTGNTYPEGLISISTDVSSNLVRLKATSNGEAILKVTMVRHRTIV
jgi:hypothetical protein